MGRTRWAARGRWAQVGVVWAAVSVLLGVPMVGASFSSTTSSSGNAWGAASSFPDYPTAVIADHPLAYYRLNDAAGSLTASDSSGNGNTGVYGISDYFGWNGLWPMDEGGGGAARDLSASAAGTHDLTLHGAGWTASGHSGSALSFDGSSAYAATSAAVVTTTSSFTVSAWVYLTDAGSSGTAVSQDGSNISGFELGFDAAGDRWVWQMAGTDSTSATLVTVTSTAAPSLNTWTQLTATYNSANNGLDLYVNGVWQNGAAGVLGSWTPGGALTVGAGYDGGRTHYWKGRVDEVRTLQARVPGSVARELTLGVTGGPATSWQFDENTGTTTADGAGHLNTGTVGSSATWAAAKSGASSVDLPGDTNGYVSGSAAGVDTGISFSVAAWVYLDHTTLDTMSRVAVSQSATIKSGFILRYNHTGHQWEFAVTRGPTDNYSPVYDSSYSANGSAALTTWTHLVGVYDANAQAVTLFVNGVAQTPTTHTSPFTTASPLEVGRVKEFGGWVDGSQPGLQWWGTWAGRVDDVQAYRRALTPAEVTAIYNGGNAGTTLGMPGALQGAQQGQSASTALAFSSFARSSYDPTPYTNPTTYSLECWFRSKGNSSGQTLISFSNLPDGNTAQHDRRIFLDTSGHVVAGTASGTTNIAQPPSSYTDGTWHHVVATVSPGNGIRLYLDGGLAATATYTAPHNVTGYWRLGGDTWDGDWPSDYLWQGELDEVAIYSTELSAEQIAVHYHANH